MLTVPGEHVFVGWEGFFVLPCLRDGHGGEFELDEAGEGDAALAEEGEAVADRCRVALRPLK